MSTILLLILTSFNLFFLQVNAMNTQETVFDVIDSIRNNRDMVDQVFFKKNGAQTNRIKTVHTAVTTYLSINNKEITKWDEYNSWVRILSQFRELKDAQFVTLNKNQDPYVRYFDLTLMEKFIKENSRQTTQQKTSWFLFGFASAAIPAFLGFAWLYTKKQH